MRLSCRRHAMIADLDMDAGAYEAALRELEPLSDDEEEAFCALLSSTPKTLPGLRALAAYLAEP